MATILACVHTMGRSNGIDEAGSTAATVIYVEHADGRPASDVKLLDRNGRSWYADESGIVAVPWAIQGTEVIVIDRNSNSEVGRFAIEFSTNSLCTIKLGR